MKVYQAKSYNFSELMGSEEKDTAVEEVMSSQGIMGKDWEKPIINEFKKKSEKMGMMIHRVAHEMNYHDGDKGVNFSADIKIRQKLDENQFDDELFKRVVRLSNGIMDEVYRLFGEGVYVLINVHNHASMATNSTCMGASLHFINANHDEIYLNNASDHKSVERRAYRNWAQEMFIGACREIADDLNKSLLKVYEGERGEEAVRKRLTYGDLSEVEFCESGELFEQSDLMMLVE